MEIASIILSSALVSGVVSLLLSYVLENRRYIRDKKLTEYASFLEQLNEIVPREELARLDGSKEKFLEETKAAYLALEKNLWRVKLISSDKEIHQRGEIIYDLYSDWVDLLEETLGADKDIRDGDKRFDELAERINTEINAIVKAMNRDIGKTF